MNKKLIKLILLVIIIIGLSACSNNKVIDDDVEKDNTNNNNLIGEEDTTSDLDIELKIHDVSNFIDDFTMQSNCTNYFSYVKYRLERMQLKRFTDPNYLYSEARDLSYFEEYLSNIIEFEEQLIPTIN